MAQGLRACTDGRTAIRSESSYGKRQATRLKKSYVLLPAFGEARPIFGSAREPCLCDHGPSHYVRVLLSRVPSRDRGAHVCADAPLPDGDARRPRGRQQPYDDVR